MIRLETPRLLIREIEHKDKEAFSKFNNDQRFYTYLRSRNSQADSVSNFIERNINANKTNPRSKWSFTIVHRNSQEPIGDISLGIEINTNEFGIANVGYSLNPDHWGQGLMTEALIIVTKFGHKKLKFHRIQAIADSDNVASWKVLEKCGYIRESLYHYKEFLQGQWRALTYGYASIEQENIKQKN